MHKILTILLFIIITSVNAQIVTFKPTSSFSPCLGQYIPITFEVNSVYDSINWIKVESNPTQNIILGHEDTLIFGPKYPGLSTVKLELFNQGTPIYLANNTTYIIQTTPFRFSISNDTTTCVGDSVHIKVNVNTDSISKLTWKSNRSDVTLPYYTPTTPYPVDFTTEKPGKFWVTATGNGSNFNCVLSDTITIQKIESKVNLGPDKQTCENDLPYLTNLANTATNSKYLWSFNGETRSTKGIYPTESGIYKLTTTSPSPNFCEASDEIKISINSVPKLSLTPEKETLCKGEVAIIRNNLLNGELMYKAFWSSTVDLPIIGENQETITVRKAGTYYLTLETEHCSVKDSSIIKNFNFDVNLGDDYPETCTNDSYMLKNLSANTEPSQTFYVWRTPSGNSLNREVEAKTKGKYILTVTSDSPQCTISDTIQVNINPIPVFDLGENKETDESFFTFDGTFENKFPKDQFNYNWTSLDYDSTYSTTSTLYLDKPGEHFVNLELSNNITGCKSSDSFVIIIPEEPIISSHVMYIPDAISPLASNQENSKLKVLGPDIDTENFEFKLFNRWGEMIFETLDFDYMKYEGWDATDANSDIQNGTYTYTTKGQFKDGETFNLVGTVSILR